MPRVTISEPGKTPQPYRFKLERKIIKIGRRSNSDIVIECNSASTDHCTMERVEGGYILRDNDSTNGIKQDDQMMNVIDLFDEMEVLIGDVPMKFQLYESEVEILSEEEFTTHQQKKLPRKKEKKKKPEPEQETEADPEEDAPRKKAPAKSSTRSNHSPTVQKNTQSISFFFVFALMIAGVIAGLTLRHYRETGDFLISKWVHGTEEKTTGTPDNKQEQSDNSEAETNE